MQTKKDRLDPAAPPPRHVLDATMFWSRAGGGVHRYLLRKRAWLRARPGWRHTLVAPGVHGAGMVDCGGCALPFSGGYRLPWRRPHAARLIERQQPDLIEAGDPFLLAWAALDAARRQGIPTVAFCHSDPGAMAARLLGALCRRAADAYLRRAYAHFDLVLAPSRTTAEALAALGIAHVERQPLGVDAGLFHPARRDAGWRRALGFPDAARLLLYTGRFAVEKNLEILVQAVERLGPPYLLVAVGAGPLPPAGAQVRVLPYVPGERALARIYASVDGFVHAGDQETFGLSALEAMASGTPIAVRGTAGLAELADGGCGVAVASASVAAWAEAIESLFDAGRERRVAAARARAETLDWNLVIPALVGRYQRLLAGNAGGGA